MGINLITDAELRIEISRLLWIFYDKRVAALQRLDLRKVLAGKNPYLYRAISSGKAADIVEDVLRARISSSDETIFGNEFFEPLALWVAQAATANDPDVSARTSSGAGVDLEVERVNVFTAIAVKSGTRVFNAQSRQKQKDQFKQARNRLFKTQKQFDPVVGYSYGRLQSKDSDFRVIAGEAFWGELSGDSDMYLRIIRAMDEPSQKNAQLFQIEYEKAVNRFTRTLLDEFSDASGELDWDRLAEFNSSVVAPPRAPRATLSVDSDEVESGD